MQRRFYMAKKVEFYTITVYENGEKQTIQL